MDRSRDYSITRRDFLTAVGSGLVSITVTTACGQITPGEAREKGIALRNLTAAEGRTLECFADVLLPGAGKAGIAHYVDDQLKRDNPLFLLKYMDYPSPHIDFYRYGLASLELASTARYGKNFENAEAERQIALVQELSQKNPADWSGPPAPLFYFVVRNDAVDVVYGTPEGFERLRVPYMAHIMPPTKW